VTLIKLSNAAKRRRENSVIFARMTHARIGRLSGIIATAPTSPEVKKQIIDMAVNGNGIRDTGRVLGISKDTVVSALKKRKATSNASTQRY
jgi:DNA invertase Pin-like site-specific DNA recombinase